MTASATNNPAVARVDAAVAGSTLRPVLGVVGFAALVALAAQVRIPVPGTPVPMTLQLLAVLLAGYMLSARAAMAAMAVYIAAGTAGLGVFAAGSAGLFGVTGGYLIGFVAGAGVVAGIRGRGRSLMRLTGAGAAAVAVVLSCGVCWWMMWFGLSPVDAIGVGVLPFLPKAMIELGMAVVLARLVGVAWRPRTRWTEEG